MCKGMVVEGRTRMSNFDLLGDREKLAFHYHLAVIVSRAGKQL